MMNKEMENKMEMLKNMTVKQLREEAKAQGVTGMSRKSKEDIINAIMNAAEPQETQSEPETPAKETKKTAKATKTAELQVALKAFTGMVIDIYTAEKTAKGYKVTLKSGKTLEFNKSGKQVTKNARFANYIEIIK
jgi:hypothetical protein